MGVLRQRLTCMKKRSSLVLLIALASGAGNSVAQDFNSLDVIVNLTSEFKRFYQKKQRAPAPPPPPRVLRIKPHGK